MIAKNEGNEGYRIRGGRLTLDGTPVPIHPRALLDALGAHFAETGEDLEKVDRLVDREFVEGIFERDRERTLPLLAESLSWSEEQFSSERIAAGFAA